MPSRVQARKDGEEATIVNRLKASCVPRKFPSLYVEIVESMLANVGCDEKVMHSLLDETVSLLPEHAVAFSHASLGIGRVADAAQVESTREFCDAARAFRGRLVRPGVQLVITSDSEGDRPRVLPDDAHEYVTCSAVAGCLPMRSAHTVTALCCCCGKSSTYNPLLFELCACGSSIFCADCRSNRMRSVHDCLQHEQRCREIVANLILK